MGTKVRKMTLLGFQKLGEEKLTASKPCGTISHICTCGYHFTGECRFCRHCGAERGWTAKQHGGDCEGAPQPILEVFDEVEHAVDSIKKPIGVSAPAPSAFSPVIAIGAPGIGPVDSTTSSTPL